MQYARRITYHLSRITNPKGFTLIEILVVIGILAIVALIGTNMFFTILKGSAKTRILAEVKQNGNYALNVMERMIRNGKITSSCGPNMSSIKILSADGEETEFACEADKISSNSASLTSSKVKPVSGTCDFDCYEGEEGVSPDEVIIKFDLTQAETAARLEEQATVSFQTSVTLRNY